ncbi:MAG: hypothetical protein JWR38_5920 [Mucilaginibacter sp.]|nr:hypothetical protein [Mucilaginibacter sp.]
MRERETLLTKKRTIKLNKKVSGTTTSEKKNRNSKYKTPVEKKDGKRKRNRESYHRRKVLKKVKPNLNDVTNDFDKVYKNRMFLGLRYNNYHVMVTLTNHDLITVWKHDNNVTRLLIWLEQRGFINQSFKVNEHDGSNYHSHILMEINISLRSLKGKIKKYWQEKYGFVDVLTINSQAMKERVIRYCLKQLNPTSRSNKTQELIDTWDLRPVANVPAPKWDLFKDEAFLASVHREKDKPYRKLSRVIMFDPVPLKQVKRKIKRQLVYYNEPLGIY